MLGGTGQEGFGLALRWAAAGYPVVVGSRDEGRAREAAQQIVARLAEAAPARQAHAAHAVGGPSASPDRPGSVRGTTNLEAATEAELTVLTVPFRAQPALLAQLREALRGKVVIDTAVPLATFRPPTLEALPEGSSAGRVQALLPESRVAAAFHTVSAVKLQELGQSLEEDTLVCADHPDARQAAAQLAESIGLRALDAGGLERAAWVERLAALVIALDQRYRRRAIGVRLTGL